MIQKLTPHNFYILRTPLLPYSTMRDISLEKLKSLYQQEVIREALFVSSPELYEAMLSWLEGKITETKNVKKLETTLLKYILRMSFRCTPFGLFAGISLGGFGEDVNIQLVRQIEYKRHSRLDMDFLGSLSLNILRNADIRNQLLFFPNNTLYKVGNQFRYVEYRIHKKNRTHHLVTIDSSEFIQRVIEKAKGGARPAELIQILVDSEIATDDAKDFVEELINGQVLVSELGPFVTGHEYIFKLCEILNKYEAGKLLAQQLTAVADSFHTLDNGTIGNSIEQYKTIVNELRFFDTAFDPGQLFQVDMLKPVKANTLNHAITEELENAISFLAQLNKPKEVENLISFKESFYNRYEQQELPLLEILDAEMGIGYPATNSGLSDNTPLLDELYFRGEEGIQKVNWSAWDEFLFDKYLEVRKNNSLVLNIDKDEVKSFLNDGNYILPTSLYSLGNIYGSSSEDIKNGNFQLFHTLTTGPSAANLLGRFCYLDDALTHEVRSMLAEEEAADLDCIFAEIVHINQARIGNISLRPVLRKYEIPILIQPSVDDQHTIPLDDILVSVREDKIILRSKKSGKKIIPRLSTAHNYALQSLPYYHFLCDLQFQDIHREILWKWGALKNLDFLPRVTYGKVILAKARWVIKETILKEWKGLKHDSFDRALKDFQKQKNVPRFVTLSEGDHELPLDLENQLAIQLLHGMIGSKRSLTLEENLCTPDNLVVKDENEKFASEFIIPWKGKTEHIVRLKREDVNTRSNLNNTNIKRVFNLGSEWLYFKIYCGIKTSDKLLTEVIKPLAGDLVKQGLIDRWFFIRYKDPDEHLRIRFHGRGDFYFHVLEALNKALEPYLSANLIHSLKTDSYKRELERYGMENIIDSEILFFHDSEAVGGVLCMLEGDEGDRLRWLFALLNVDYLLSDFGMSLEKKRNLLDSLQQGFKKEFKANDAESKKALGNKFREERLAITTMLGDKEAIAQEFIPVVKLFEERSTNWKETIENIKTRNDSETAENLITSYVHMSLNRFFRSKQRMHEMVIYDFLFQYYNSSLAMQKQKNRTADAVEA